MSEVVVIADGLVKRFGAFTAVDHLSFEIRTGEIYGFLGPNGSGKSTTIRMLCGLLTPSEGDALVGGVSITKQPEKVREQIGYMSQRFSLYPDLTVLENLEFYAGVYGVVGRQFSLRSRELIERLELADDSDRLAVELSTGIRQRLALACALIHEPPILFLDEPTSGVDPAARRRFFELIEDLAQSGVAILVTTHVMDEAEHCHRLLLIHEGRRVAEGSARELKALVPGQVVQVRAQWPMKARQLLEQLPEVLDASLFGTALHVTVTRDVADPASFLTNSLRTRGVVVTEVQPVETTLEHAFLALTSAEAQGSHA